MTPAAQLAAMRKRTPKVCPGCGETFAGLKQQKVCGDRCRKRVLRKGNETV